jgi:ubiquinone/menaquinone biosynthesis C-methylase UbiE
MSGRAGRILERVSRSCSLTRVFVAGEDAAAIADQLRLRGAIVEESRATTLVGVTGDLLATNESCTLAIVCVTATDLGDEDARYLFAALRRTAATAYLRVSAGSTPRRLEDIGSRAWWERHAVASGFRRHPAFVHLVAYEELDVRSVAPWLLLEAVPHRSESPLDELRSVAADAESILWRYGRATHFVRRHDRVLDLDCGVGAGLSILSPALADSIVGILHSQRDLSYAVAHYGTSHCAVEFRLGGAAELSQCPDQSFDIVLSCRPLPSTSWSTERLDEIRRVLTPGGRLICCVAEQDLTVRDRIATGFLLERVLGQSSGGDESTPRRWHELAIDGPHRPDVDWWFVVAMKDPLNGTAATYQERLCPYTAFPGGANPTGYVRAFENPWLHASVFTIGARVRRDELLEQLCRGVVRKSPNSLDAAGAYCVIGYQLLESPSVDASAIAAWLEEAAICLGGLVGDVPATLRWRVSLLFIAGRLAMRASDHAEALERFRACMAEDATKFSSLLGTKTIEAAYWAGLLAVRSGDIDEGRRAWSRGVDIARMCIEAEATLPREPRGSIELFGFREFAHVFDVAGRCAAALAALDAGPRWEQRLSALLPQASISSGWSDALAASRWALEDARSRAHDAMFALQWQRDLQLLEIKASTNDALLRQIVHRCRVSERSVVIWGAGTAGRRVLNLVLDVGGAIDAFVDSNPSKHGTSVAGRPVIAPRMLASSEWLDSFVLIGSMHASEIEGSLLQLGFQRHDDFMRVELHGTSLVWGGSEPR